MSEHNFNSEDISPVIEDSPEPEDKETVIGYINSLKPVQMHVSVVMGESEISVKNILSLKKDDVVELDRNQNDDVDIYINSRLVAKGQIMAVDDEYAVRITKLLAPAVQNPNMEKYFND